MPACRCIPRTNNDIVLPHMQLHLHVVDIANRAVPTEPFRITLPAEIFEHLQQKFFARVTAAREVISLILDAHYPTLILL